MFEVSLPTKEQLRQTSLDWQAVAGPTMLCQWPADLMALSAPTTFVDLPRDNSALFEAHTFEAHAAPIAAEIDAILGFARRFFRLNSRSPKDAPWPFEIPVSCSGKEILSVIAASERCLTDLCLFQHADITPKIALREFWPGINPRNEFRCFVRDGLILAVAEYANAATPELWAPPTDDHGLRAAIGAYLIDTVMPRCHLSTVVIDIVAMHDGFRLLEINPYGRSDPVGAISYERIEAGIAGIARLPR